MVSIVIVYDGAGTLTPYIDGVAGAPTTIAPLDTVPGTVLLGETIYGAVAFGGDKLRQFAVYPTAFTDAQVTALDNALDSAVASQAFSQPAHGTVIQDSDNLLYTPGSARFGVVGDPFGSVAPKGTAQLGVATATLPDTVSSELGLLMMYRRNAGTEADIVRIR